MDLMEITEKERLGREEAAARLRALADGSPATTRSSTSAAAFASR